MTQNNDIKDKMVLFSWILGLLIITCVFWISTQNIQARYLLRTVNNMFISNDDTRRVSAHIPNKTGNSSLMGYWYKINNSQDLLFVFTVFQDGILIPIGAVVSSENDVKEIFPLSAHAEKVFTSLPQSVLEMYIRRIEAEGAI